MKNTDSLCYLCSLPGADSRDHVPPRGLFFNQRPSNLLTLPAHQRCQGIFAPEEQIFIQALKAACWGGSRACLKQQSEVVEKIIRGLCFLQERRCPSLAFRIEMQLILWQHESLHQVAELLNVESSVLQLYTRGRFAEFRHAFHRNPRTNSTRWVLIFHNRFLYCCDIIPEIQIQA